MNTKLSIAFLSTLLASLSLCSCDKVQTVIRLVNDAKNESKSTGDAKQATANHSGATVVQVDAASLETFHQQPGKVVVMDFYADWCIYCKMMEKETFPDPRVSDAMSQMILLQADVTANDDADKALQKHIGIPAPPAMIFWGADGAERRHLRLLGFMGPNEFAPLVEKAIQQ